MTREERRPAQVACLAAQLPVLAISCWLDREQASGGPWICFGLILLTIAGMARQELND